MEFEIIHLPNGVRVLFEQVKSPISHVCVVIEAGSRNDTPGRYGLAHFIEHLLFKRTSRRSTNQILNRLESVGGDLNAYTTKEYTCLHASFLNPYLDRTLDLLEDLLFHSTYPDEELEKERSVIQDEISSYLDSPEDAIQDDFEDLIFKSHSLGHNILGTLSDLKNIQREDIEAFLKENYRASSLIVGISGHYSVKTAKKLAEKYFGHLPSSTSQISNHVEPIINAPAHQIELKSINQVHYMMGSHAYSIMDDRRIGLALLNNHLGGMGMSSKLNMLIREKYGIAYTIESNYSAYLDTGLFSIYFGTDIEKFEKAKQLLNKELNRTKVEKLGTLQLYRAKKKFKGQLALAEENRLSLLISQSKYLLDYGHIHTLDQLFSQIDQVTSTQLLDIANEVLADENLYSLSFIPE